MNRFSKNSEAFNKSSDNNTLYTGLAVTKVLAINPTKEKLAEIVGEETAAKFDTTYAKKENQFTGKMVRPLHIWVQDKDEKSRPTLMNIDLGEDHQVSNAGNIKFINHNLQDTWAKNEEDLTGNPKMGWYSTTGLHEAKTGEVNYYKFIAQLFSYNFEKQDFFEWVQEMGIDFNNVYEGNFEGVRELVDFVNLNEGEKEPFYFVALWVVRETTDGQYRQQVLVNPDTWYRCNDERVSQFMLDNLQAKIQKKEEEGYNLTNKLFTLEFEEFNKAKCYNAAPVNTVSEAIEPSKNDAFDWID